jgi:hypothetical protein
MAVNPCFIEGASNAQIDSGITPEFAAELWRYTKAVYSENGVSFPEALPKLAADFNMPERVISRILNHNKSVRVVAEDVAKVQLANREFLAANRRYIANASQSDAAKILNMANEGIRGNLLALHGPVIGGIHPIDQLFTPGGAGRFFRAYWRSVKAASPAETLKMMSRLQEMPRYPDWVDAGLPLQEKNVPGGKGQLEGVHVGGWGGRAMDAGLKPLMYEYAEKLLEQTDPDLKTPGPALKATMQDIARQASFATGTIPTGFLGHGLLVRVFTAMQLARSLNTARWMKTVFEPLQTADTYAQTAIGKASRMLPEQFQRPIPDAHARAAASRRLWQAGKYLGGMVGALLFNDQLNRSLGSKSRVNLTDPTRADFMAFKVHLPLLGDYYIKTRGSMEVLGFLAKVLATGNPYGKQKFGQSPEETVGRYTEYKMTPSVSLAKELTLGRDVFGRPVPWSAEPGNKAHPRYSSLYTGQGNSLKDRVLRGITSVEYASQHAPIFLGHGIGSFYEGMREHGVNPTDLRGVIRAVQQHPELVVRPAAESAGEFFGINAQHVRGKPYVPPAAQQRFERTYLPAPIGGPQ